MKHPLTSTILLLLLFVLAQVIGLNIISHYVNIEQSASSGKTVLFNETYIVEPLTIENESLGFLYLLVPLLFATGILLVLIKLKVQLFWKLLFALSATTALFFSLYPYVSIITSSVAVIITILISLFFVYFKIFRYNIVVSNAADVLMYGGIAAVFVPILNILAGCILLVAIACYDAYAVWKSKHMIALAEFQLSQSTFAGISLGKPQLSSKSSGSHIAILGGGDIIFPLLFAGTVLKYTASMLAAYIIVICAALGLLLLLLISKKGKYYPAMIFISAGCLIGYAATFLL